MFGNGCYAKLWEIKKIDGKNYYQGRISTSHKNQNGEYETDFSANFVRFVGEAAKKVGKLQGTERILIDSCGVTNRYDKEKKAEYTNYTIFDFTVPDGQPPQQKTKAAKGSKSTKNPSFNEVPDTQDDELPFN